jgi:hypothetical protein
MAALSRWWFAPAALGRVAALRVLAYVFIPIDVLLTTSWVGDQAGARELYRPLVLAEWLRLPVPTPSMVVTLRAALLTAAVVAAAAALVGATRAVRIAGGATAALYLWWMFVAMSYGKVDHDRFAFLVLLAVLPTVGAARPGDRTRSAAAGWAVRTTQVAVVATYFLAAWAKVRIGGWGWVNGGTLAWALVRRNTALSGWMVHVPGLLRLLQWATLLFELASPLLLVVRSERTRTWLVAMVYGFHLATFALLGIIFLPHLVALAAFLPLERIGRLAYVDGSAGTFDWHRTSRAPARPAPWTRDREAKP